MKPKTTTSFAFSVAAEAAKLFAAFITVEPQGARRQRKKTCFDFKTDVLKKTSTQSNGLD